jgi:hypothetical protein
MASSRITCMDTATAAQWEEAARFVDEWDQLSIDPTYRWESLRHFEPLVRRVFAHS